MRSIAYQKADRDRRLPSHATLLLPAVLFLLIFFCVPLGLMLSLSVYEPTTGEFGVHYYSQIISSPLVKNVLLNTFKIASWTTVLTILFSYPVAYYIARRPRSTTTTLLVVIVLIPFWTSVLIRSFAWMVLLGRNGFINSILREAGIIDAPLEILYTFFSVIVSSVHALMPIAVMTMLSAMQNIDLRLESAASTLGAAPGNVFWRIYFPLSYPGVAGASLVTFVVALGMFVQSSLLGSRHETMIAQLIIQQIDELFNWGMASALAVTLLVTALIVIVLFDLLLGISSVTGSGSARGSTRSGALARNVGAILGWGTVWLLQVVRRTGNFRRTSRKAQRIQASPVTAIVCLAVIIFLAAPSLFLIPISFTEGMFLEWPPQGFSLKWYDTYFSSPIWRDATIRSLIVATCTAVVSTSLGVPAAFALTRFEFRAKKVALPYIMLPLIAPNILVALALFYYFAQIGLVGTSLGLIIGHTIFALPYVVVTMIATLKHYDHRIDHAAWTLGATKLKAFFLITLPVIKVGFIASFLFAFVRSFDELTVSLFISKGLSTTLPRKMWSDANFNIAPTLAAVSTIIIVMVAIVITATEFLNRKSHVNR